MGTGPGPVEHVTVPVEHVTMCCLCDEARNLYWYFLLLRNSFTGIINLQLFLLCIGDEELIINRLG